jgi:hypothetical protein
MKKRFKMRVTTVRQQTIVSAIEVLRYACPVCEREVEMLTGEQAIRILGVDPETLDQLVAAGQVHSIHTVTGNIRVCKDSLVSKE